MGAIKARPARIIFRRIITGLFFLISFYKPTQSSAQTNSDSINHKKLNTVIAASAATYTLAMVGLAHTWYSDFDRQSFRFFNDASEWKQIDKVGHFYSAFHLADLSAKTLRWTGLSKRKSNTIGTAASFVLMSSIEIFDGYSSGYGASVYDIGANAAGAYLYLGQQLLWDEIRVYPKFSFHQTYLSNLRPNLLGSSLSEEILKDYNGQTYWLSVDMDKFTPFPKWLNWAVGYGGHDMIFASDSANEVNGFYPYRQFYLSLDIDLTGIKTKSKAIKTLFYIINMVKLPTPTLEFSKGRIKPHAFYF